MSTDINSLLVSTPGICGGLLRIAGTRITVHQMVILYKRGYSAEAITAEYTPYLSLGQVYTALAYYHVNQQEVEASLTAADAEYEQLEREHRQQQQLVPHA